MLQIIDRHCDRHCDRHWTATGPLLNRNCEDHQWLQRGSSRYLAPFPERRLTSACYACAYFLSKNCRFEAENVTRAKIRHMAPFVAIARYAKTNPSEAHTNAALSLEGVPFHAGEAIDVDEALCGRSETRAAT